MERRSFLKTSGCLGILGLSGIIPGLMDMYTFAKTSNLSQVEARFYKKLPDREIECELCPRYCKLGDKERGYCGVRENIGGTYYTLVYGKACAVHADPIEKKPLFHFLPKSTALSIASAGCNVNCKFCQNWEISQVRPEQISHVDFPPEAVAATSKARRYKVIAYTYTEPTVFYEYMFDSSIEARKLGIKNVVITGGHINPDPLEKLIPVVDGIKIDLKSFSESFYKNYVRGELRPVLEAIKMVAKSGTWLEIVYLVIPTLNDTASEITRLSRWIIKEIGQEVPVHFSRFHPMYLLKNLPPTPVSTIEKIRNIMIREGVRYVYIGNVPGHYGQHTYCPSCSKTLITRAGYTIGTIELNKGKCRFCGTPIPGIWK